MTFHLTFFLIKQKFLLVDSKMPTVAFQPIVQCARQREAHQATEVWSGIRPGKLIVARAGTQSNAGRANTLIGAQIDPRRAAVESPWLLGAPTQRQSSTRRHFLSPQQLQLVRANSIKPCTSLFLANAVELAVRRAGKHTGPWLEGPTGGLFGFQIENQAG